MKKLLALVALLSMLALASCNRESTDVDSTDGATPSNEVNIDPTTSDLEVPVSE